MVIVALNGKLVFDQVGEWVDWAAGVGLSLGPVPVELACAGRPLRVSCRRSACSCSG